MNINYQNMTRDNNFTDRVLMPEYLKKNVKSDKNETNRLMDIYVDGILAEAKVLKIEETGVYAGRNYCKISLEVKPNHSAEFNTTGFAPVPGSLLPRAGNVINIKYNPADVEKFVII